MSDHNLSWEERARLPAGTTVEYGVSGKEPVTWKIGYILYSFVYDGLITMVRPEDGGREDIVMHNNPMRRCATSPTEQMYLRLCGEKGEQHE